MKSIRVSISLAIVLLMLSLPLPMTWGHEVVGEVTPLMLHSNHTLAFIKNGREGRAMQMAKEVFEDFEVPGIQGKEAGFKTHGERVDRLFGTSSKEFLTRSIIEEDISGLQKGIEFMSFLLMLEKLEVLRNNFENKDIQPSTQLMIFWLGRNYFSYLLEPTLGEKNPIEEKRLDRLLDRMLYSVEDREWEKFLVLREELIRSVVRFFNFPIYHKEIEASR